MSSSPELSVVCGSCGSEVSPYVTECPYCGTRLRKRAPKLERHGDELAPKEGPKSRRRERRRRRGGRLRLTPREASIGERPSATIALIVIPAAVLLVERALRPIDLGAIIGPVGDEWWRYLTSPFVYTDVGYLFVIAVAVAIWGSAVERRLGTIATLFMALACGALGMLAADGIETGLGGQQDLLDQVAEGNVFLAAGGNGIALGLLCGWAVLRAAEVRGRIDEEADWLGPAIAAAVLIALPLVEDTANVFAGLAGGLVGAGCALAAVLSRGERRVE